MITKSSISNYLVIYMKKQITKIDTKSNVLELLVLIIPKKSVDHYAYLVQSFESNYQIKVLAKGAATTEIIEYLGLTNDNKIVLICPIKATNRDAILAEVERSFNTLKNGKGVAFITPFSSMVGKLAYGLLSNNKTILKEEE